MKARIRAAVPVAHDAETRYSNWAAIIVALATASWIATIAAAKLLVHFI